MNAAATFWTGVLLLAIGLYGGYTFYKVANRASANPGWSAAAEPDDSSSVVAETGDDAPEEGEADPSDFALTTQSGALFQSKSLKGKVWVGSVFFSLCPRECKLQNQAIAQLRKQLKDHDLTWVSLTCDPQMDTPKVLAEYAKRFDADSRDWKFLTGKEERIRPVAVDFFKVPYGRQVHSKHLVLVGRDGKVVGRYDVFDAKKVASFKKKVAELMSDSPNASEAQPDSDTESKPEASGAEKERERAAS